MYGDRIDQVVSQNLESIETGASNELFQVLFARYTFDVSSAIDSYIATYGESHDSLHKIPLEILKQISQPEIETKSILFPETLIPQQLLVNNSFARDILKIKLDSFISDSKENQLNRDSLEEFLISNHEWIKWSLNTWFLVNSSTMAELIIVDESIEEPTMQWVSSNFGVEYGQPITHPHLISTNGKKRLAEAKFPGTRSHLTQDDYTEMLRMCYELSISTNGSKGFIGRSWIYNPAIHKELEDGRPFVAFNFLEHDFIAGMRKFISVASPDGMFPDQYGFASRNDRRKSLIESGRFSPDVYAVFHTNKFFQKNIEAGLLDPIEQ